MIESATTNSVIGRRGNSRSPKTISARAPSPTPRLARLVSPRCRSTPIVRVKKLLPPLLMPNNFGSWVEAITRPAPSLNPLSTVSETKLAMVPKRSAQAMMPTNPASTATVVAKWTWRSVSPAANVPTADPIKIEIAEVGPMASWREVPKAA